MKLEGFLSNSKTRQANLSAEKLTARAALDLEWGP
ncbi:helicase [Streptomyces sp. NPDC021622]